MLGRKLGKATGDHSKRDTSRLKGSDSMIKVTDIIQQVKENNTQAHSMTRSNRLNMAFDWKKGGNITSNVVLDDIEVKDIKTRKEYNDIESK